jgi:hypothetical protein
MTSPAGAPRASPQPRSSASASPDGLHSEGTFSLYIFQYVDPLVRALPDVAPGAIAPGSDELGRYLSNGKSGFTCEIGILQLQSWSAIPH